MKFTLLIVLVLCPVLLDASSARPIELMKANDIADVKQLDVEVERLAAKVRQCAAAGLAPATECHCQYPSKLASAKNAYQSVIQKHPEWEDQTVLWWDQARSYPSNLHFRGLRAQFESPCS